MDNRNISDCTNLFITQDTIWTNEPDNSTDLLELKQICYVILLILIYLGFYVAFNTVQVISRQVVGRAEETSTVHIVRQGAVL